MAPITSNNGGRMDSILGTTTTTTNIGSPNKRKWRRKSKPKQAQNAFGKLVSSSFFHSFLNYSIIGNLRPYSPM